jgi:hypothetical protein
MTSPRLPRRTSLKSALAAVVFLGILICGAVVYQLGLLTKDAGRYSTRQGRTVVLHPSDVSFQLPQDWLSWNFEFHNNLHLSHRELQSVRFATGEWDSEYSEVVNSALPFEHCAAHIGGEGWGRDGVSFGDLQLRAYVTDLSSEEILERISSQAFATAAKLSSGFLGGRKQLQTEVGEEGPWRTALIRYSLDYGDYGGIASVEFYLRPASKYQLVMVFMGNVESEKRQILDSVNIGTPTNSW